MAIESQPLAVSSVFLKISVILLIAYGANNVPPVIRKVDKLSIVSPIFTSALLSENKTQTPNPVKKDARAIAPIAPADLLKLIDWPVPAFSVIAALSFVLFSVGFTGFVSSTVIRRSPVTNNTSMHIIGNQVSTPKPKNVGSFSNVISLIFSLDYVGG